MGKKSWRETIGVKSEVKYPLLVKISVALCRLQSAIPALWLQSATPTLRIRFETLRRWCVKFLPRIFLPINNFLSSFGGEKKGA